MVHRLHREQAQAGAGGLLVGGVDVVLLAAVGQNRQRHIGLMVNHRALGGAQSGPVKLRAVHGQLHHKEGQRPVPPIRPPPPYQAGEQRAVIPGVLLVLFALIVPEPPQRVGADPAQHGLIEIAGALVPGAARRRRPGKHPALGVEGGPAHRRVGRAPGVNAVVPGVHLFLVGGALGGKLFLGLVPHAGVVLRDAGAAFGEVLQLSAGQPAVGKGSAPVTAYHTDMQVVQMPGQRAGGIIGHSGHGGRRLGPHHPPAGALLRSVGIGPGGDLGHGVEMKPGVGAGGQRLCAVAAVLQLQLHVALSARQPDLTQPDVGEGAALRPALHRHGEGAARRQGRQRETPLAVLPHRCVRLHALTARSGGQGAADCGAGGSLTPDGQRLAALQDHILTENSRS